MAWVSAVPAADSQARGSRDPKIRAPLLRTRYNFRLQACLHLAMCMSASYVHFTAGAGG